MKIHLNVREHVCSVPGCGQAFGRKSHLIHHLSGAKHANVDISNFVSASLLAAVEQNKMKRS